MAQNNMTEALKIFEDFLRNYSDDPSAPMVENLIGLIYFEQNNYDRSLKYLTNATSSDDPLTRAKAFTMIGEIELEKKNYILARRDKTLEALNELLEVSNKLDQKYGAGNGQ